MLSSEPTAKASRRVKLEGLVAQACQLGQIYRLQLQLLNTETEQRINIQLKTDLQADVHEIIAQVKECKDERSKIIRGADLRLGEIDELQEEGKSALALQAKCINDDNLALQLEQKEAHLESRISELFKEEKMVRKRFLRLGYQIETKIRSQVDFQQKMSRAVTDSSALEKQAREISLELEAVTTNYTKSWGQQPTLNTFDCSDKVTEQATTIGELRSLTQNQESTLAAKEVIIQLQQSKIKGLEDILEQNGTIVVSAGEPQILEGTTPQQLSRDHESKMKEENHTPQANETDTLARQFRMLQSKLETYKHIVESLSSGSKDQASDQKLAIKKSTMQNIHENMQAHTLMRRFQSQAECTQNFEIMERNWTSPRGSMFLQWLKDNSEMNTPSVIEAFAELSVEGFSIIDIIKLLNKDVQMVMGSLQNMHDVMRSKKVPNPLLGAVVALHELDVRSLEARVTMETYVPHRTYAQLRALGLRYTAFGLLELGEAGSVELMTFDDGFQVVDRRSSREQRVKVEAGNYGSKKSLVVDAATEDTSDIEMVEPKKRKRFSARKAAPVFADSSSDHASKKSRVC